jgi:hypothetical protein
VVSHPAPSAGFTTEFLRTRITSAASQNNELGVRLSVALCHRGSATSRGGFFFSARFIVNAIPAVSVRFFAGLTASLAAGVCESNAVLDDTFGLWCDATDSCALSIVGRDNSTTTKNTLSTPTTLTAGTYYRFEMFANPNANAATGTVVCTLINEGTGALLWEQSVGIDNSIAARGPRGNIFLSPQVGLSNALNAAGGDTSLDIISIYCRPRQTLVPLGTP